MFRRVLSLASVLALLATLGASTVSAGGMPSGQVTVGNVSFDWSTMTFTGGGTTIEPAYDDANGSLVYLSTPVGAKVHPNDHNVAPLYLPVYPVGSGIDPATLNCAHMPADNCPDHGPFISAVVASIIPGVYGGGVLGHDHLVGIAATGGDFNIIWEPVLVLFTNPDAAKTHLTTLAQINADLATHQIIEIPVPSADFHCSAVSAAQYDHGTPAPTVP